MTVVPDPHCDKLDGQFLCLLLRLQYRDWRGNRMYSPKFRHVYSHLNYQQIDDDHSNLVRAKQMSQHRWLMLLWWLLFLTPQWWGSNLEVTATGKSASVPSACRVQICANKGLGGWKHYCQIKSNSNHPALSILCGKERCRETDTQTIPVCYDHSLWQRERGRE